MRQPAVIPQPTDSGPPYRTEPAAVPDLPDLPHRAVGRIPAAANAAGDARTRRCRRTRRSTPRSSRVPLPAISLLLGAVAARWQRSNARLVLLFGVDIACITLLSDASGGMVSGLPLLLTVTVAVQRGADQQSHGRDPGRRPGGAGPAGGYAAPYVDDAAADQCAVPGRPARRAVLCRLRHRADRRPAPGKAEALASARASDLYRLQRLNEQIVQQHADGHPARRRGGPGAAHERRRGTPAGPESPRRPGTGTLPGGIQRESLAASFDAYRERGEQPVKTLAHAQ
jgi:hypothetical protein